MTGDRAKNPVVVHILVRNASRESAVLRMLRTLAGAGYETTLLCLPEDHPPDVSDQPGLTVVPVPLRTRKRPGQSIPLRILQLIEFAWKAAAIVRRIKPAVIHCHDIQALPLGFMLGLLFGGNLVYDSRHLWTGVVNDPWRKNLYWAVERLIVPRCRATIFYNDAQADHAAKLYGIKPSLVLWFAPNPIAEDRKRDILDLLPASDAQRVRVAGLKKVLHIGYLSEARGAAKLIDSMEFVENAALFFLGPDPAGRDVFTRYASSKPWSDRIFFVGPVAGEQVSEYAASCDAGATPLQNDRLHHYLNSPNKFFETLMAGIPMVVSDFPVMGRLVREYGVGEAVNETDPRSIADGIKRLIGDQSRIARMKENIRRFQKDFAWDAQAKNLLKMYENLIQNLPPGNAVSIA